MNFIDCGHGKAHERFANYADWEPWKNNENATACFGKDGFDFGIYQNAVNLTTHTSLVKRYVYSLFWGFQVSIFTQKISCYFFIHFMFL